MDGATQRVGDPVYSANLERTIRELQRAADEAEAELKQVCFAVFMRYHALLNVGNS